MRCGKIAEIPMLAAASVGYPRWALVDLPESGY
jgi:hypothetical protein